MATTIINADTGINQVQDGTVTDADLNLSVKPMFSAIPNVGTSIASGGAITKIAFNVEEFDTTSAYDSTLSRFTPKKAGYYNVTTVIRADIGSNVLLRAGVLKNGSVAKSGAFINVSSSQASANCNCIVYCNGTTDYIEAACTYSATSGTSQTTDGYFQAHYIGA